VGKGVGTVGRSAEKNRPAASTASKTGATAPAAARTQRTNGAWQRLVLNSSAALGPQSALPSDPSTAASRGLAASSTPLDPARRAYFERRYDSDFSAVRIHRGPAAEGAAHALDARAFTVGNDIVLGAREDGGHSDRILAHELAHVVQQRYAPPEVHRKPLSIGEPHDLVERAADTAADAALRPGHSPVPVQAASSPGLIRRVPRGGGATTPKKAGAKDSDFTPVYIAPDSAAALASRGAQLAVDLNVGRAQKLHFVLFIITDALYVYSETGAQLGTFRITGTQPILGLFFGGSVNNTAQAYVNKNGEYKLVPIAGWKPEDKVLFTQWTTITTADEDRLAGGDLVPIIIAPGYPADKKSATAPGQAPDPGHTPDPNAVQGPSASAGKSGSANKLKQAPSGAEYEGAEGTDEANYPAFPATIHTPTGLVPVRGLSELTMHLDWTYGESSLIGAVWNASTVVKYKWERWDITSIAARGKGAKEAEAKRRKQTAHDKDAEVDDQYISHDAKQRARDIAEDVSNSASRIKSGGTPGHSTSERIHEVSTEVHNLAGAAPSTIVSMGGHLIDSVWHLVTKPDNEIDLEWNTPGHFLIRCVATPQPHEGRRYLSSVATTFVEARDAEYIARDTLGAADALMDYLRLKRAMTTNPTQLKEIDDQIAELQIAAHGSAVEALRIAIKKKQLEVDAAIGRAKTRRQDELDALNKQLEIAERTEKNLPNGPDGKPLSHAARPEAAIASEVTGATYPLLLQLVPISFGDHPRWAIYDVTTKGDKLGYAYVGQGASDEAAIVDAFINFSGDNEYGRGTVVMHIPDSIPNVSNRELVHRNVRVGDALAKDRLHDLVAVLIALSLFVPGVGEAAMLLGGALAAEHIIERWRNGNLEPDAALITDIISILGAIGSVAGNIAGMMVVESERGFALAVESGDATAIKAAMKSLESAAAGAKAVQIANEIVAYGGLMWGDIEMLKTIRRINEDEDEGRITHSAARTARAHAVLGALQGHLLMFAGPLHEQGGGAEESGTGPGGGARQEAARREEAPVRDQPTPPEIGKAPEASEVPAPAPTGAGAVKGKLSYELRTGGKPLDIANKSARDQIELGGSAKRLKTPAGEAQLRPTGTAGEYMLDVGGAGGRPATSVKVTVEFVKGFDPASQPHGGDEGPVRLDLVRSGGKWEASIKIDEMAREKDLSKLTGHEFDEIVDIIRNSDPAATDEVVTARAQAEMRSELFRPGAPSGKPATSHDRAAARELGGAYNDLAPMKDKAQKAAQLKRIAAMEKSMGLDDPVGARERAEALEAMGVLPRDTAQQIRGRAESLRAAAGAPPSSPTVAPREFPPDRASHTIYPDATSPGDFAQKGIGGGHSDAHLKEFLRNNAGTYRLTLVKQKTASDGTVYRAYEQEMNDGAGNWTKAMFKGQPLLKTTADNASALLDAGLAAFDTWNAGLGGTAPWGGKANGLWSAVGPNGVEFSGYATFQGGRMTIITIYPEGAWVLR